MARWKLKVNHYLPVSGCFYEQVETANSTGETVRSRYDVPKYLDISDPKCWTEFNHGPDGKPVDGNIIVCNGEGAQRRDIIYTGEPTPDMEPLDEEAEAISASLRSKWAMADFDMTGQTYAENVLIKMQSKMASIEGPTQAQFNDLLQQNAVMLSALTRMAEGLALGGADADD